MTTTKTVEAPVSFAGAFDFPDETNDQFIGQVRRYQSYSHLSDAEYDKELNARGFFPWLHARELGCEDIPTRSDVVNAYFQRQADEWGDYTVWK